MHSVPPLFSPVFLSGVVGVDFKTSAYCNAGNLVKFSSHFISHSTSVGPICNSVKSLLHPPFWFVMLKKNPLLTETINFLTSTSHIWLLITGPKGHVQLRVNSYYHFCEEANTCICSVQPSNFAHLAKHHLCSKINKWMDEQANSPKKKKKQLSLRKSIHC